MRFFLSTDPYVYLKESITNVRNEKGYSFIALENTFRHCLLRSMDSHSFCYAADVNNRTDKERFLPVHEMIYIFFFNTREKKN